MRELVGAALAIVRDEGVEALTLQRLAAAFEVTAASLYRYFPAKDALVAELQRSVIAWLAVATRERIDAARAVGRTHALDPSQLPLLDVIVTALAFEAFARKAPVEFGLLTMHLSTPEYALSEREAARVFETAWRSLEEMGSHLDAAARSGALAAGNADERAVTLWSSLQGVVQTRKLVRSARERIDPTRLVRGLLTALLVGWGAAPSDVEALTRIVIERDLAEPQGSVDDLLAADVA